MATIRMAAIATGIHTAITGPHIATILGRRITTGPTDITATIVIIITAIDKLT
jgi:hypothetical protein